MRSWLDNSGRYYVHFFRVVANFLLLLVFVSYAYGLYRSVSYCPDAFGVVDDDVSVVIGECRAVLALAGDFEACLRCKSRIM